MVSCKPHEILRTVNVVHFRHIDELFPLVIDHITQLFRDILRICIYAFPESPLPVISLIHLVGNAEIGAILSYGHGFQKRGRMPVHRVLQCLDGRFPIFHLNFEIRHYAVKFLLCNPSCTLLVQQVMRHGIVEPVRISDNDINHLLQIVEETG